MAGVGIIREEHIGPHRLILGDSLEVMPQLGRVAHVISDPPYEQRLHDLKGSAARKLRTDDGAEMQALEFDGIDDIRAAVIGHVAAICDGWLIAFCTIEGVAKWADVINPSPIRYKRACIWIKPDSTPQLNGQGPAQGAECFVTAWCGLGYARWNGGGKRGVYTHQTNPRDRDGRHPTEKPWRLMADLLRDFTNPGDVVLDPFMGSGTTIVACHRMGRAGIGIERDPSYFDVACDRVERALRQPDLFHAAPAPKIRQESML